MTIELAERLLQAVSEDRREAGLVVKAEYQPVGGPGGRVFPPTFPGGRYLLETRLVDGEKRESVVLDQVPSQANRVEEQLGKAAAALSLPMFALEMGTPAGPVRITSLDAPHRYADAYWRDCLVEGTRFDASVLGKTLRAASPGDATAIFAREPYTLLYGAWDSHRQGRQNKFARLYSSEMYGLDPQEGARQAGRVDPLNLTGAIDDANKAEGDWKYFQPGGERVRGKKLSEIGHGHIAPNSAHGGVTVASIHRRAWISFAGLERLGFGAASDDAATLARATLAALALIGDRLTFGGPSIWLRSGCDLTKVSEAIGFEVIGGQIEPVEVSTATVIDAFNELRERAARAGLSMASDVVKVEPTSQLKDAILYAVTKAAPSEGE